MTGLGVDQSKTSKQEVSTTNVTEHGIFHRIQPYSFLILLLSFLFQYLQKKKPGINYVCFAFQEACCHFAICRPACPVQCDVFTLSLCLSEQRERSPFSLLSAQFRALFSSFKWTVDEVSLIRLSQLTLVSAVSCPCIGLTSPCFPLSTFFSFFFFCTFHPGFHPIIIL